MNNHAEFKAAAITLMGSTGTSNAGAARKKFQMMCNPSEILDLLAERDQLKAENERLNAELECPFRLARHSKRLVEKQRASIEDLRKTLSMCRDFLVHDAKIRKMLDKNGDISSRHPLRTGLVTLANEALRDGENS